MFADQHQGSSSIRTFITVLIVTLFAALAQSATLPLHSPLRILIVSDEVNPHCLPDSELTQPGDISAALAAPGSGINIDVSVNALLEIATNNLSTATSALLTPFGDPTAYDVLIYYAHRIPSGGSGAQDQADFVTAVDSFLTMGGGVISFHHGAYLTAGKEAMQDILGCTATGSVPYDTLSGQNVINTSPAHFITTHEVEYTGTVAYSDVAHGVAAGNYDFFNNLPDERYPNFVINPSAGDVEILFGSDYVDNGSTHILGLTHSRPEWLGVVVTYQPGEYQPNALDDLEGNNFQILANAIYYVTHDLAAGIASPELERHSLAQNYPNPFNPMTTIEYEVMITGPVVISVYDASGRLVRVLENRHRTPGSYKTTWDGKNTRGDRMASGVYFYQLGGGASPHARRMVLLK